MKKQNNQKKKKLIAYALTSALVLSNLSFTSPILASEASKKLEQKVIEKALQDKAFINVNDSKKFKTEADLKPTDIVRVIVELEGQTPIEFATEKGTLYKELPNAQKQSLETKALNQQDRVKKTIASSGINIDYKQKFTTVMNGFSGEVLYSEIAELKNIPGVKNVYIANEYKRPDVEINEITSDEFIQTRETWEETGYKGEGMIVSIIDTGVDPAHKDFILSDDTEEALTKDYVESLIDGKELKGKYFTEKVPYGYNYFDGNDTILDLTSSMHGMHVAGISSSNGDETKGGMKGVAPESQVLAMKVFSNDPNFPSTWSDVYVVAIDESIKLGADVLNMSLGDVSAFYEKDAAEDLAIQRAVDNGIVSAVAAGNSGHIGYGYSATSPLYRNPDLGTVGAPSVYPEAISVASSASGNFQYQHTLTINGETPYNLTGFGVGDWSKTAFASNFEIVSLGSKLGYPEDFDGIDVEGKVVVIPRGTLNYEDKANNAKAAGAVAVIITNTTTTTAMVYTVGKYQIPAMMISKADGDKLLQTIGSDSVSASVTTGLYAGATVNRTIGKMSAFTSWGITPSLEIKPEITAPGGSIRSTLNNNQYGSKSGTSMATPQVAGASALVQQYLQKDERFGELTVLQRTKLVKTLLMNTSKIIYDVNNRPVSPRLAGSGMMQTYAAVSTPVYFVHKASNEPKVELKAFKDTTIEMTFVATNVSDKAATYTVDASVLTDAFKQSATAGAPDINALQTSDLVGAIVTPSEEEITVPANGTKEFTVTIDISNAKIKGFTSTNAPVEYDLKEDIYVEGSVHLVSKDSTSPDLTIPYVGFYGNWDNPDIFDGFKGLGESIYYDFSRMSSTYRSATNMLTNDDSTYINPTQIGTQSYYAFSPNDDAKFDNINVLPTFLRNAKQAQFNIVDEEGKVLRRLSSEVDVYKNAYDGGYGSPFSYRDSRQWDGKVKGKVVEDGVYYYEMKAVIDFADAKWQTKKVPVYVDTTAPEVTAAYDSATNTLSWTTVETGTGVKSYQVYNGDTLVATYDATVSEHAFTGNTKGLFKVVATDKVENTSSTLIAIGDTAVPKVYLEDEAPVPYGYYNTFEVDYAGYASDDIAVKSVEVNGESVELSKSGTRYSFSGNVTLENEGLQDIFFDVTDYAGKTFSIARKVFIDVTAPTIEVTAPTRVDLGTNTVDVTVNLKDNFNYLTLYTDDNMQLETPFISPVDYLQAHDKDYKVTLELEDGVNKFLFKVADASGNEAIQEVVITQDDKVEPLDVVAPTTTATVSGKKGKNDFYQSEVIVTLSATDDDALTTTEYSVDGETWFPYTSEITLVTDGTHVVSYRSKDTANNVEAVQTLTVKIDKTPPAAPKVSTITDSATKVTGRTEAGSTVKLYLNGKVVKSTTASSTGAYSFTISKKKAGTIFKVTATDKAGNVSKATSSTVIDKTPPAAPKVTAVKVTDKIVTGTAEAGSTVYVYKGTSVLGKAIVSSKGTFTVKITAQKAGTKLKVTAKDKAGNTSKATNVTVK